MNVLGALSLGEGSLSGSLGSGRIVLNDYLLSLSEIPGGHRLTLSRGNETQTLDIPDGEKGDPGRGIASVRLNGDYTLTLTFTDGTQTTTPSIRGEAGASDWSGISSKPQAYPPEAHTHVPGDIDGLGAALAHMTGSSAGSAQYHLGFYLDADGDLCQSDA